MTSMQISEYDTKEYKTLMLDNGLKVILVRDKSSKKSSAALSVNVGAFSESVTGIAHFLEHLLFMGNQKYPDENHYDLFITRNGGSSNAYTSDTHTCYFFDINSTSFLEALDIFSQMFVSSLLNESSVDREMKAVHSEFTNYMNNDNWRSQELLKSLSNPLHPFSRFMIGNSETLKIPNIVEHVKKFYNDFYSANLMNLSIASDLEFDVVEPAVRSMFSLIVNKDLYRNKIYPEILTSSLGSFVKSIPIKNTHILNMRWQIPLIGYLIQEWKFKPSNVLSNVLGHEGKGSILSKLIQLGFATQLMAGEAQHFFTYSIFGITIVLTDSGINNTNEVINVVMNYIKMCTRLLNDYSTCEYLYTDFKNTQHTNWLFKQSDSPMGTAIEFASAMQCYDFLELNQIFKASEYLDNFCMQAHENIKQYLAHINDDNFMLSISSKNFQDDVNLVEKWFGTQYCISSEQKFTFSSDESSLHIPLKNLFVPIDFSMQCINENYPSLVMSTPTLDVYVKKTNKFGMPHAFINARLLVTDSEKDTRLNLILQLLTIVTMQQLNDVLYDAELLHYSVGVYFSYDSLMFQLYGFNDKLSELLKLLVDTITKNELERSFFDLAKEQLLRSFNNEIFKPSYQCISNVLNANIKSNYIDVVDKIRTLELLTFENFSEFVLNLQVNKQTLLIEGNASDTFVTKIISEFTRFNVVVLDQKLTYNIKLPFENENTRFEKINENKNEHNNCVFMLYCYEYSHPLRNLDYFTHCATSNVINLFFQESFFDELRTKQQLGYIVQSSLYTSDNPQNQLIGQYFLVQSPTAQCDTIVSKINEYIETAIGQFSLIEDSVFENYISTLVQKLRQSEINLTEIGSKDTSIIASGHTLFNSKEIMIEEHLKLSKNTVIDFLTEHYKTRPKKYTAILVGDLIDASISDDIDKVKVEIDVDEIDDIEE